MNVIDLRSDTVTQPTSTMRQAMANAKVGDDVYGDDPSINLLESIAAETLGKQASLFVTSGTQANLLALLVHCQRGDEYIAGQLSHIYCEEGGGGAVLASIQPQPVDNEEDGTLCLDKIQSVIKDHDDFHFAKTNLLCLENTMYGKVLSLEYLHRTNTLAKSNKLHTHLDGARLFNAAVKLNCHARDITLYFDSVNVCLSKGLGAPVGSILAGTEDFIKQARRWRKVLGGGMRQAGIIAAAGLYALEKNISRLSIDHENAQTLSNKLSDIEELDVKTDWVQTNMVFFKTKNDNNAQLCDYLNKNGILVLNEPFIRLVTHLDFHESEIDTVVGAIKQWCVT
jgi:threonine aldolase